jgi:hypothetical protein
MWVLVFIENIKACNQCEIIAEDTPPCVAEIRLNSKLRIVKKSATTNTASIEMTVIGSPFSFAFNVRFRPN